MRFVVQITYQPALLFPDSNSYLYNALNLVPEPTRPIGYAAFLRPLLWAHNLAVIAIVQHTLGLALGVALYALLVHLRLRRWVAALAAAPVLFDAFQLDIEQYVMSDTLFEAFILAAVILLVWRGRRLGWWEAAASGAVLALATIVRFDGAILAVPALLLVVVVRRGWSRKAVAAGAFVVAFGVPLLAYASWYDGANGEFAIQGSDGRFLYGHVAPFADCTTLTLPTYEQPLCPAEPIGGRHTANWYVWTAQSPSNTVAPPAGMTSEAMMRDFAVRVIEQQPVEYVETVFVNFFRGLRPTHATVPGDDVTSAPWVFGSTLPATTIDPRPLVAYYGGAPPHAIASLGTFLGRYQHVVYVPGTLLGCCAIAGLLGGFGVGRARRSSIRLPTLLFTLAGVMVVIPADAVSVFSWRYQLPQLLFLPAAAALGLTALLSRPAPSTVDVPSRCENCRARADRAWTPVGSSRQGASGDVRALRPSCGVRVATYERDRSALATRCSVSDGYSRPHQGRRLVSGMVARPPRPPHRRPDRASHRLAEPARAGNFRASAGGTGRRLFAGVSWLRMSRYTAGSVICFAVAEVAFTVLFDSHALGARGASVAASVAGIIPGYWLNRRWTWGRQGRSAFWREVVPYWAVAIASMLIAALAIGAVNGAFADHSRQTRTIVNAATYMATYGVLFVVKYALFDKVLFAHPAERRAALPAPASGRLGAVVRPTARTARRRRRRTVRAVDGHSGSTT